APVGILVGLDENGLGAVVLTNGLFSVPLSTFSASMSADPGPGGLSSVLTYDTFGAPFVPGDVLLTDADAGGAVQDVIRFNPGGFTSIPFLAVPEPGSVAFLLVTGIGGVGLLRRRRRKK